jgi:hypothetical protein
MATTASKAQGMTSSNGIRALISAGKPVHHATHDLAFTPGRTNNGKVIETHFFEHPSAYGFGWFVSLENDAVVLERGSDSSGYRTQIIRVPSRRGELGWLVERPFKAEIHTDIRGYRAVSLCETAMKTL